LGRPAGAEAAACREGHGRIARQHDRLGLAVPGIATSSHGGQVEGLPDPIERQEPAKDGGTVVQPDEHLALFC
jgi:hypothetical protein